MATTSRFVATTQKGQTLLWGTDSVWYGSPQWQIEAMRRLEIPQDLQKSFGYAPLGGPRSDVKEKIFAGNGARLYGIDTKSAQYRTNDKLGAMKVAGY